jgi:hypoxanthine-guanine phosphoribosyltransferase
MKKLVLNNENIRHLVSKICREISTDPWTPDLIVGINRGGLVPGVMISQWFDCKHVPLSVSLRDHEDCESNLWLAELAFGYHRTDLPESGSSNPALRKNILIVDDINDTGATFNWIMNDWPSGCLSGNPAWKEVWGGNVKFAVLVDNLASECERKMDFCGMEINKAENDVWADFPWEDWWTK